MRKKAMNYVAQVTKQELASHRVELNVKADIQKFLDEVYEEIEYNEDLNKEMDQAWARANSAVQDLVEFTNQVKNHLPNLDVKADGKDIKDRVKKAADELGVKPDAVKGYDLIDVAIRDAKEQQTNAKINIKDSKPPTGK